MSIIYVSYADKDVKYGSKIKSLLKTVTRGTDIVFWSMQDMLPGVYWRDEMKTQLRNAALFIALISSDFLASDRCLSEVQDATKREHSGEIVIINVLLRPNVIEEILPRQATLPKNGVPVTRWKNSDAAWNDVAQSLVQIISDMRSKGVL